MGASTSLVAAARPMVYGLICLGAGSVFATLFASLTRAGQAGVLRMTEYYPRAESRLRLWEDRWDVLRSAMLICSTLMQVGIVAFAVLSMGTSIGTHRGVLLGVILSTVVIITLFFNVLPRALSRVYADRISILSLPFTILVTRAIYPAAWLLARVGHNLQLVFLEGSRDEDRPTPEDEILSVVEQASMEDLEHEERSLIQSVLGFGERVTREIMTPRVDLESLEDTDTVLDCVRAVKSSTHSRFPVFHETLDDIRGVIHVRDLLRLLDEGKDDQPVKLAIREAPFVPESMPLADLLTLLCNEQAQLAIVVDEYGGTAGLVTIDDIVEELVGDIRKQHNGETGVVQRLSDGSVVLPARLPVDEANELLDVHVPEAEEYDSVGGFIFHALGRIPRPGEVIEGEDFQITVQTANARQLQTLRLLKKQPADT